MPSLPPRPCTYPRCAKMAVNGGRCEAHKVKHGWRHTKSRHERGYGSRWERIRNRIINRDKHLCQECLRNGRYTQGKQVDHITPKYLGGTDFDDNLELLCDNCHTEKTAKEAKDAQFNNT